MHRTLVAVRPLALLRAALACTLLAIAFPAAAHAQCGPPTYGDCDDGSGPGETDNTPYIAVSPADLKTTQPNLTVTVTGSDDRGIQAGSLHIYAGNQEVTSQFSYTETVSSSGPVRVRFTATGNVRLLETGPTTVYATVCDNASVPQCTSSNTVTYTLSLPGVSVSPHGSVILDVAAASYSRSFTVTNRGTSVATFSLTAECRYASTRYPITPCAPSMPSVSLGPQVSQAVAVSFPFTAVDSVLNVRLVARQAGESGVQDVGWIDISPIGSGGGQAAPTVRIAELNNDATGLVDRSQCLTVGAGAGAAYECGDLRLVHALPATSTRGKTRAPVLHYSSALAQPRPTVYADVTIPASASAPGSVVATVTLANGVVHTRTFRGSDFYPGSTRRIGVQWDGTGMTAWSVYDYTLQVTAVYGTAQLPAPPVAGKVTVLTRATSPYGAGWWIAGQERLMCVDCGNGGSMMVVGGDGSTRLYNQIWPYDGLWWASAEPDGPPDTLRLSFPATGSQWTRKLRGGGEVHYDGHGRHWRTISRLGDTTLFTFVPNSVAIASIVLPRRDGGTPQSYVFGYDASGRLSTITAPANGATTRQVTLTYGLGDKRITAIRDPDTVSVQFAYDDPNNPRVVTARTDRRRTTVRYGYDAAGKLATVKVPLAAGDTITSTFRSAEGLGVATTTAQTVSVPRMYAYTRLDGPRTDADDATYFWLDRWGAPSRIRDALGAETWIIRGDSRFRALPTTLVAPSGLTTTAVYDGRGRVSTSAVHNPLGDGQNAVTTYTYDDVCDAPKTISAPLVGTVTVEYDPATCNVLWQQQGDASRRVNFRYYASGGAVGLLRAVQAPLDAAGRSARDSLVYDGMGNLSMTVSPLGFVSLTYRDAIGRDTLTVTPIDSATATTAANVLATGVRQRTVYDVLDRVTKSETIGPARSYTAVNAGFVPAATPLERLEVSTGYDDGGLPLWVLRSATPDYDGGTGFLTEYGYDAAGRKIWESSTQAGTQSFTLDKAGNVTVARTATGYDILMRYDALNRLTRRTVPERTYGRLCDDIALNFTCEYFPRFPNFGDGYKVPEEWHHYRYDAAGNQSYAENADARVQRTFLATGAVRTDSTWIRAAEDASYAAYGLRYTYDVAGRVTALEHPTNLTNGTASADQYTYHSVTGALGTARTRQGPDFLFFYDNAGRLTSTRRPGGITDSLRYDVEGRLTWRHESGPYAGVLHAETMRYDARGKLLHAENGGAAFHNWYSGLGTLVGNDWYNLSQNVARVAEELRTDPLGSTTLRRTSVGADANGGEFPRFQNTFQPSTGRLVAMVRLPPTIFQLDWAQDSTGLRYDAGGNVTRTYQRVAREQSGGVEIGQEVETRNYYGADDRLRALQKMDVRRTDYSNHEDAGVWEEYRYDALGRRVMVRTRTDGGLCNYEAWGCTASTTRFVWSGDQLLWELKSAGGAAGGNVSYFHAGGIDRPLMITRDGTSVVPHENWRGQFSRGTYTSGYRSDCTSYPASGCTPIQWPGERTTVRHELEEDGRIQNWFGGLVDGMRDASGQMYMRNRYYDPKTGQFTQADPIGLAGGLNAYGFADGDPVSYADPYGLSATGGNPEKERIRRAKENRVEVFFWTPLGNNPSSQFGHVSVAIGDKNYSLAHGGFDTQRPSATDYIERQQLVRSGGGIGLTLNLTPAQVERVRASIEAHSPDYNALSNNCTDPIESALNSLGFELGTNVFPNGLKQAIRRTGLVQQETYYPPTNPPAPASPAFIGPRYVPGRLLRN